jgi:hypothetical protein
MQFTTVVTFTIALFAGAALAKNDKTPPYRTVPSADPALKTPSSTPVSGGLPPVQTKVTTVFVGTGDYDDSSDSD